MNDDFIETINDIDFSYGFIYECANLINNLYDCDNYDHLAIKLCSGFIMPIINITKKEHIKEYNEHIKNIIDNLESIKDIYSICSYLMNICSEEYFKLSQDEYLEIKKFIDNDIDIIEPPLAPMNDYFDPCKKCYSHYYCSCYYYHKKKVICIFPQNRYKEFHEKIIKSYFNIWYIKFFYLLQKNIKLHKNSYNINVLMNIFMNLYNNSGIKCNKKMKIKYMICIIMLFLINSFIVINLKIVLSLLFINKVILLLIYVRSSVVLDN